METEQGYKEARGEKATDEEKVRWESGGASMNPSTPPRHPSLLLPAL